MSNSKIKQNKYSDTNNMVLLECIECITLLYVSSL